MQHMVTNALRAYQAADPGNAARYASNAVAYVARLAALDAELSRGLKGFAGVPLATFHDAFPYFARRYGLRVVGVVEEIPDVDPTPRHLSRLGARLRAEKAQAIFVEPRHSRRLAERISRDLGIRVGTLDTLETGPANPAAYEEGMRANLRALQATLKPARP
jgi:ABC-type Zn uptake system ZnuABC Zn-binding protein ZnuA